MVRRVERLAEATGLSKTAAVRRALDRLLWETFGSADPDARMAALPAPLDPFKRADANDALKWDAQGPPR